MFFRFTFFFLFVFGGFEESNKQKRKNFVSKLLYLWRFCFVVLIQLNFFFFFASHSTRNIQIKNVKKNTPLFVHSYINLYTSSNKTLLKLSKTFFLKKSTQISPFLKKQRNSKLNVVVLHNGGIVVSSWLLYLQKLFSKKMVCGRMM